MVDKRNLESQVSPLNYLKIAVYVFFKNLLHRHTWEVVMTVFNSIFEEDDEDVTHYEFFERERVQLHNKF